MTPDTPRPDRTPEAAPIGFAEFVALTALLMALVAMGIDTMLPALPQIGASLHVASENERQFVVTAFFLGFGPAQLVHGPLADRFGRRTVVLCSVGAYIVCNILCAASGSFALLLAARWCAGAAIAATRVSCIAIVRDRFEGRAMARVMSTVFIVFMIVPVLAPTIGQGVLLVGDWRTIFAGIAGMGVVAGTWFWARMPETLHAADRQPLSLARVAGGWRATLSDRLSLGYTLAAAALQAGMYGYLNSIQQVTGEAFGRPALLTLVFASAAGTMAFANFVNARLVMRLGTRLLSHAAVSVMIALAGAHLLLLTAWGHEPLAVFVVLQAVTMACFGLSATNFSTMAMQNMGHIAGTANSVQGFVSVTLGALIGAAIGQAFDGSARPLVAGFLLSGVLSLALAAITERGRLFRPAPAAPSA